MLLPASGFVDVNEKVEVTVYIEPAGKARHRSVIRPDGKGGHRAGVAPDKKNVDWKKEFKDGLILARMRMAPKIRAMRGKPLRFELELYFQPPKKLVSWWCNVKVDNDNSEKNVWDALLDEKAKAVVGHKVIQEIIEGFMQDDHHIVSNETMKDWAKGAPCIVFRMFEIKRRP